MGLFDRLTGTKRPADGVVPRPAAEVRAALLGLNRPDVPYVIRDGRAEGVELVGSGGCWSRPGRASSPATR